MGVPKRRVSKQRKRQRRSANLKVAVPALVSCPRCHQLIMPHRACPACGYYKAREVIKVKAKTKRA